MCCYWLVLFGVLSKIPEFLPRTHAHTHSCTHTQSNTKHAHLLMQNNGVIALTRCANRRAGYMCCCWLVLFGVLSKLSAIVTSIPDCVLGGMITFLFANIVVSGVRILGQKELDRRDRFVVAAGLGVGIGVAVVPQWATNALWVSTSLVVSCLCLRWRLRDSKRMIVASTMVSDSTNFPYLGVLFCRYGKEMGRHHYLRRLGQETIITCLQSSSPNRKSSSIAN